MIRKKSPMKNMVDKLSLKINQNKWERAFHNKYPIDEYIDNFWFQNCPDSLTIKQ